MKIVISSGHGLHVRGANNFIDEVNEARRVVSQVVKYLKELQVEVSEYHDNTSKTQRDNINRIVAFHNSKERDLDVSVHLNAASKTDGPRGVEVLYVSESGRVIAEKVSESIAKASGLRNRGAKIRTDLGFLNITKKTAIIIEVCFVDSKADVEIYHNKFNEICKAIAESLTGKETEGATTVQAPKAEVKTEVVTKPSESKPASSGNSYIKKFQEWLKNEYKYQIALDGIFGPKTKKIALMALQTELNRQFNAGLIVDGIWGPRTKDAIRTVSSGAKGNITRVIQGMLYCLGYDPKGFDGIFGNGTYFAVIAFQKNNKLTQDGFVGKNTFEKMFK